MIIHFVCMGNTYRSRLAEAYFNSLGIRNWSATSSGIRAERNLNGDITTYARSMLEKENMIHFTSHSWHQTTKEMLEKSDVVVFMHSAVYEKCETLLRPNLASFHVWDIRDIIPRNYPESTAVDITGKTFVKIKQEVDLLVQNTDIFSS